MNIETDSSKSDSNNNRFLYGGYVIGTIASLLIAAGAIAVTEPEPNVKKPTVETSVTNENLKTNIDFTAEKSAQEIEDALNSTGEFKDADVKVGHYFIVNADSQVETGIELITDPLVMGNSYGYFVVDQETQKVSINLIHETQGKLEKFEEGGASSSDMANTTVFDLKVGESLIPSEAPDGSTIQKPETAVYVNYSSDTMEIVGLALRI